MASNTTQPNGPIAQQPQNQQNVHSSATPQQPPATPPKKKRAWLGFSGKTLWDWLNLLGVFLIPLMIGVFTFVSSRQQSDISQQQHNSDMQIALDQQREVVLVTFQRDISDLLLTQHLDTSKEGNVVRVVARARTLAALSALDQDGRRKRLLIQFLDEAQLLRTRHPIIDLSNADLSRANLSGAFLRRVNLSGADLSNADLSRANLSGAFLDKAVLKGAVLSGTILSGAYLWSADLSGDNVSRTDLSGADLTRATLKGVIGLPGSGKPPVLSVAFSTPLRGLEDEASPWLIDDDKGQATASVNGGIDPSSDGEANALQISLLGGKPYAYIQTYRNLPANNAAQSFELSLTFYIPELAPVQALEFTMNKWVSNQRWEWALQWQRIGDGTAQQGNPPNWRVWTGSGWQDTGVHQDLTEGKWYKFDLTGDISNGQVHYISFSCDNTSANLGQTFAPVYNAANNAVGDKLAVGVQLDGDNGEDPYDVAIDRVNFQQS